MALKPLNSVGGFSVGEIPANVILANADIISNNLTVQKIANLGPIGNVKITGGVANQYIQTDGTGNLTFTTADTSRILNGTSNVSIPVADGNVTVSVGGTPNVVQITTTGMNVAGTGNFTGNLSAANANLGNLVTANFANLSSNLFVTDTANVGNLRTNNLLYANGQPWDLQEAAGSNTQVQYNDGAGNFGASANFTFDYAGQILQVTGNIVATDTANVGNLRTDNLLYANGQPWDLQEAAGSNQQIQYNDGAGNFGASANLVFDYLNSNLTVTGNANVTGSAKIANVSYTNVEIVGDGNGIQLRDDTNGAQLNWNNTNYIYVDSTGASLETAGGIATLYANGNMVFPGNVTAHTFYGNVNANVTLTVANTEILFSDNGLIAGATGFTFDKVSNLFSTPGDLSVTGTANINGDTFIESGNIARLSGSMQLYSDDYTQLNYNNQSWIWLDNGGLNFETGGGVANMDNSGNWYLPQNLEVAGNIANVNNISVTNNVNAVTGNFSGNVTASNFSTTGSGGNITGANVVSANTFSGNLLASYANVTGNTITNNLTVNVDISASTANFTGNVSFSGAQVQIVNDLVASTANFSGNISALNANLGNIVDANHIRTADLYNGTSNIAIDPSGNIRLSPTLGNVVVVSSLGANIVGYVQANGTGSFGALEAVSLTSNVGNLLLQSEQAGNTYVQLRAYGDGTIDVGSARISSLATPTAQSDAATKQYVDDVAQGLNVHDAAYTATGNTLAILTGGTITYNNGTGGVGANLVLSGSPTTNFTTANCFDGNTTATVGSRILVKNEANAAHNGVYVVSSSTVLTRADDYNTVPEVEAGDFIFVEDGDNYNDTGWVQTSIVTTIGTDPITFTQFSGAGTYKAGNGLTLTGTVFSVNVDNVTTEISGGNVVVKPSAQLTTPNIGAATGTSVDLTGNVLANNVNSNNKVTAVDIELTGNVLANFINANANLLVNNANINVALNGNTANFTSNVVMANLTVNANIVGSNANFSGNVDMQQWLTVSNTANVGNLRTDNLLYANGTPWDFQLPAGANTQIQYNDGAGSFGASANLTFDYATNTLGVLGNANISDVINGNIANFTGNLLSNNFVSNHMANVGNLIVVGNVESGLTPNANLTYGLGNSTNRWNELWVGSLDVSGDADVAGNISANNFSANNKIDIGTSQIVYGNVTTTAITANQTIATLSITGVTGVEWMVKGYDSSGSKYSMAIVTAVTDGSTADYSTFGTVNLGGTTGTLAVNIVGSNIELQVTPASTNSTVWITQFRTI